MVLRQIPVNIYDVVQLENYLSYMAEQGLFLKKAFGFGIFQRGIGEKVKYHVEFLDGSSGSPDKEKLSQFEDAGWEYICKINNNLCILKAMSEEVKELTIEPDALKEGLNKAKKKNRNALLYFLFYFLFLSFIVYDNVLYEFPIYFKIQYSIVLFILVVLIMGVYALIIEYKNFKNIRHCLKFGCDYSQKDTYPTQYRWVLSTIAVLLLWIFMLSLYTYSHLARWEKPLAVYQGKLPGISLSTIETSPNLQLENEDTPEEIRYNMIKYHWTALAPEIYTMEESGVIDGYNILKNYQPGIITELYILRYEFLVNLFISDYMKYQKNFFYGEDLLWQRSETTKFDQAFYGYSKNHQKFFASQGKKVIYIDYYGDKDLFAVRDEIYQSLDAFDASE